MNIEYRMFLAVAVIGFVFITSTPSEPTMTHTPRKPLPPPEEIEKLPPDGGTNYNRLVFSQSPYLLQHAANPVDWHPWGDEAFARAREENKLVFLSVGYSTCHWCHVMEHESFEDEEVAALLNRHFVCVKVDREERPDVDKIYMDVTQAMTGSGGWPMTVVLTPDRKPFFAGTYFPKSGRYGKPGMMDLIPQLAEAWKSKRDIIEKSADQITAHLQTMNAGQAGPDMNEDTLRRGYEQLQGRFDRDRGGFGSAPKFPTPHHLTFLLRTWKRSGDSSAVEMVEKTLTAMRLGGIYDHVGFGFHRYSTDEKWLLPHFEKMLYDQALLSLAYIEAWLATRNPLYEQTAREIFTYVLRDMTSPEGGFYSAEDADAEGVEGKFNVWTTGEIETVLGPEDAAFYIETFHCLPAGNFTHEAGGGHVSPDNIPHLSTTAPLRDPAVAARLDPLRQQLFDAREKRVHPLKDDKILTDWNGLMIAAMARGGSALGDDRYVAAARRAADFMLAKLRDKNGRLLKRSRLGKAGLPGHVEDYAFAVWGLLNLYEATYEVRYLAEAKALNDILLKHFWDPAGGGLFITADDGEELLVRGKEIYDGAIPSGNSVSALNLLRLARMTGHTDYEDRAGALMRAFSGTVDASPMAFTQLMSALDFALGPTFEVVIVGNPDADDTRAMVAALRSAYLPGLVSILRDPQSPNDLAALVPYTKEMTMREDKATAYVCRNFACNQPTTSIETMLEQVGAKPPMRKHARN